MEDIDLDDLFEVIDELDLPRVGEDRKLKRRETACLPGHLSQPIYGGEVDMLLGGTTKWRCNRHRDIFERCEGVVSFRCINGIYEEIESWLLGQTVEIKKLDERCTIMMTAALNWTIQRMAFVYPAREIVDPKIVRAWCKSKLAALEDNFRLLKDDLSSMMKIEYFKDNVCFTEINLGAFKEYRGALFERDLSILPLRNKKVLVPTTLVMCCADKLQSRFGLRLYWLLSDIHDRYPGHSILETGDRLIKQFRGLRRTKLEGFFSFCASWEPLIVGDTIRQDGDEGDIGLFLNQIDPMSEYLEGNALGLTISNFLPPPGCPMIERRMWLELTGMVKILGYPILKEDMLLDQLKEHGVNVPPSFSFETMRDVMGIIKRDFIVNYRQKRGKFPNIRECPENILDVIQKDGIFPNHLMGSYGTWSKIRFSKTLEFDYSPDLSDVTKDSAAAVSLSQWPTMFDRCAFYYHYDKPPPCFTKSEFNPTRVIDAFLTAEQDLVRKVVRERERLYFNPEDRIIVQCGKELEHKEKTGRAFTKQTPNQRFFQVVLEMNIAESVFTFVPEQSMTDGEIALANRQMMQYKALGGGTDFISMDLTKWCLRHRAVMVEPIGQMYDELFDLNGAYETSHDFFVHCSVFCNSRISPPDYDNGGNPVPGPFFMNNFVGGCEGLHQKKWTHITIGVIKLALELSGLKGTIMGQGDNQIVLLQYTKQQLADREKLRQGFLAQCENLFLSVGHKLKRQETWYSSRLHEYGKLRTYCGMTISQGTKKSTKLIPDINDGLFAISSSISTINTLTEAIAKGNQDADVAFTINQMLLSSYLHRKNLIRGRKIEDRKRTIRTMLMYPTDFGGISLSTYHSHAVRGHDDPVSLWMSMYKVISEVDPDLYISIMKTVRLYPEREVITSLDRTRLIEDPRALNTKTLPSAENKISEISLKFLKSPYVTNPAIVRLYQQSVSFGYDALVEALDKMEPLYPSLANVILKDSNAGIGKNLQSKFTSVKSIERSAQLFEDVSLIKLITEKNAQFSSVLLSRLNSANFEENMKIISSHCCPTRVSDELRERHWSRKLVGVTKPPHIHQVVLRDYDSTLPSSRCRSVLVRLSEEIRRRNLSGLMSFGPFKGYVGSRTQVKVKPPTMSIVEKTSYSRGLISLGRTMTWMELMQNPGLVRLCRDLMKEKLVDLPQFVKEEELKDIHSTVISGNPFHRLSSQVESTTSSINGMITITSHFSQSSNLLQGMSSDGEDYSIFFQYVYSANMAVLASLVRIADLPASVCAVLECEECTHELPAPDFQFPYKDITATPSLSDPLEIVPPLVVCTDLGTSLAVALGMEIAKNIDENFRINHGHGDYGSPQISSRQTKISINDFKRLDLLTIICSSIMYSKHACNILIENKNCLASEANDLSFYGLSHLIMESGQKRRYFEIVERGAEEHTMLTQIERFSAHISRSVLDIWRKYSQFILEVVLPIDFKKSTDGWRYNVFTRLRKIYKSHGLAFDKHLYHWAVKHGVEASVLSAFKIKRVYVGYECHEIVKHWRKNPSVRLSKIVKADSQAMYVRKDYNLSMALRFYQTRESNTGMMHVSYDFLSFLCRPILNLSSAASKYIEVMNIFGYLDYFPCNPVFFICLAEGSAGTLSTLLRMFPNARGTYNTLMEHRIDPRDIATDDYPPACVVDGTIERVDNYGLSSGETDIAHPTTLGKIGHACEDNRGKLLVLTMDAESSIKSDNLTHVDNLVPLVVQHNIELAIFKIFLLEGTEAYVSDLMQEYPIYNWALFKPLSSNPLSNEIFLVLAKGRKSMFDFVRENFSSHFSHLVKSRSMSEISLDMYYWASGDVWNMFKVLFDGILMSYGDRRVDSSACGMICIRNLQAIIERLFLIENNVNMASVKILIRAGGREAAITNQLQSIIFLCVFLSKKIPKFGDKLGMLSLIKISQNDISRFYTDKEYVYMPSISAFSGNFFDVWGEKKFFIRHVHDKVCNCDPNVIEYPKMKFEKTVLRETLKFMSIVGMTKHREFDKLNFVL